MMRYKKHFLLILKCGEDLILHLKITATFKFNTKDFHLLAHKKSTKEIMKSFN